MDVALTAVQYILAAVGAAALLVQAIVGFTNIKPDSRANLRMGKVQKVIQKIVEVLDILALNLNKDDARGGKDSASGPNDRGGDKVDHSKS